VYGGYHLVHLTLSTVLPVVTGYGASLFVMDGRTEALRTVTVRHLPQGVEFRDGDLPRRAE
jgi:hypothetical protein